MNPRQRRGAMLLVLAVAAGIGVFVSVATYVADVRSQVGTKVTTLELVNDVRAHQSLGQRDVKRISVPERWLPSGALHSIDDLVGKVAASDLSRGSYLQQDSVVAPPALQPGQREVAVLLDAETGVAGKITSGSFVDIFATFAGTQNAQPRSEVIVHGAHIIDVGVPTVQREETASGFAEGKFVPVTFALSPEESLVVTYAESFATKVRLGLLAPGDDRSAALPGVFQLTP